MKKRIMALLLSLVMALSLVPTTVWAADVSTEGADDGISVQASNSTVVLHPSVNHTVTGVKVKVGDKIDGYAITSISGYDITVDLGKYNVNNGTFRLPYAKNIWEGVDNNKVDYISWAGSGSNRRSEGGNALLANGKNTAYYYFKGAPVLLTFTLNYDANGGTGAPASQTYKATSEYEKSHTFTISSQVPTREDYTFLGWDTNKNAATASKQPGNTIVVNNNNNPTTLYAVWKEKTPPVTEPADPELGKNFNFSKDIVKVICETTDDHNASYGLMDGYYTVDEKWQLPNSDNWKCKLTIDLAKYFALYNSQHPGHTRDMDHPKATSIMTISPTWYASTGTWSSAESLINAAEIYVKCDATQPEGPGDTKPTFSDADGRIKVMCVVKPANHDPAEKTYKLSDGTYTDKGSTMDQAGKITYSISLNRNSFIQKFDTDTNKTHTDKEPNADTRITWTWNAKEKAWVLDTMTDTVATILCECETTVEKFPVKLVIYRNGNTSEAYKDIALESQPKGHVINLNELDIADYYTANYTGKYDFYGWYDDGLMNIYNANVKAGKDAPAGLTTKTVNGWTNIKCMVYDYEKVVYFKSAEDLAAYQADHSKTDGILLTTTARKGSALPTADAPTATRKGYTFQYWSREGQTSNVTGQTVGGWTNLYANWKINTYNIAATLYMNGADSSVQETGKTYAWSHRYGGEYGKPIDYTDMFAALKAKALEVDAANEPYDAEIKLCFPKSDKLFNETIKTYGQDGAFWNPGVKNTAYIWGHATTSYQVIFNTGDGSKVDTQIVKYGDKATEPAEPNRYGYEFKGWFEEGATDAFDFKNGITHKTQLTAQWEKQEYTVSSTLYLNGSTESCKDSRGVVISRTVKGLYEEPIDYATLKEALKKVALDADAANKPNQNKVDLKICWNDKSGREFDAKTYGQPGYNWREMQYQTKHWTVAYTWAYAWTYYDVTFDVNGGEGTIDAQLVKNGDKATEPTTVPTKDCHRFLGWFDADGNKFDFDKPITKSMTLYAKWELVEVNTYIIPRDSSNGMLNEDGGIPLNKDTLERVGLQDYAKNSGTEYQSILIGNFTSNAAIAEPDDYFDGDAEVVAAAKEMNAKLKLDAGINKATFDKNDILGKTEWTWLHVATGVKKDTEDYLSGDLMFYSAMFKTEDEENVTGMPKANYDTIYDYYIEGETITMPANPTRTGYDFKGWAVNGKTVETTNGYTITGDVVFTAQWEKQTYTVKFDSKGGSKIDDQKVKYQETATKPTDPTKSGYTFGGWYTDNKCTKGNEFRFDTKITGDITLYAKWDVKRTGTNPDAKNPYIKDNTTKTDGKKVESGKTFDAGIAMYVGLSILSVTGSAVVIRKRKDF